MKVKRMVKRLFAVGTGVAMLGATAMGALAADLGSYPSMFVKDGTFDGHIVVGTGTGSAAIGKDNAAATDIAANMWVPSGSGGTTTSVSGDAWLAATATNVLEFGDDINEIDSYAGSAELSALADGSVTNEKGTSNYEQFLYFEDSYGSNASGSLGGLIYGEDEDGENVAAYYKIPASRQVGRYFLDFTTTFDSDVVSASMEDWEDESLTMLGKTYTIVQSSNASAPSLTLMGGSTSDTLMEGESKEYTVGGKTYTVELQSVAAYSGTDKAKFVVNGELTQALADGSTDKVTSDSIVIGVTDVTNQNYAGGIHSAQFFIGADKVKLTTGGTCAAPTNAGTYQVNDETINDVTVKFECTQPVGASGEFKLDSISLNVSADDDFFIGSGEKLSENPEMDEPEALFTGNWDLEFHGLTTEETTSLKITPLSSDTQYDLTFTNMEGTEITIPLMFANASDLNFGDKVKRELVLNKSDVIDRHQYFLLNSKSASSSTADSVTHLLQYTGSDDCDTDTDPKIRFKNVGTGETIERSYATTGLFDIKLSGTTFSFASAGTGTGAAAVGCNADNGPIVFNTSNNGGSSTDNTYLGPAGTASNFVVNSTGEAVMIRTQYNGLLILENPNVNKSDVSVGNRLDVSLLTDDDDRKDDLSGVDENVSWQFTYDTTNDEVNVNTVGNTPIYWISDPGDSTVNTGYTEYGVWVKQTAPTSASRSVELELPENQLAGMVYVTSGATTSTTVASGDLMRVEVGLATRLADEITDATAQNLIVVGGPCVNPVAADVLGSGADCAEGFTPGKARIKLVEHANGNMAVVVAGYSGDDTRLAGRVLAKRWQELSGMEVEVEGTTYSDATIGAPTQVAAAAEEPAAEGDAAADAGATE